MKLDGDYDTSSPVLAGWRWRLLVSETRPMILLSWIVIGFVVGMIARLIVPTGRRYGCIGTILLGIGGSAVGGTLASLIAGDGFDLRGSSFVGSVFGAVIVLVLIRWNDSRRH